jgi:hypothetical protein
MSGGLKLSCNNYFRNHLCNICSDHMCPEKLSITGIKNEFDKAVLCPLSNNQPPLPLLL